MPSTAEWIFHYNDIVDLYHEESDRSAAILASSVLDAFLADAIRNFLVDEPSIDELFSGNGPLSTFSARINIAFALGLITPGKRRDLHLIRKIRNHFAHHPSGVSFTEAPVRDHCANLSLAQPIPRQEGGFHRLEVPRDQFLITVGMSMLMIHQTLAAEQRRTVLGSGAVAE